jgi:hypothetical protein
MKRGLPPLKDISANRGFARSFWALAAKEKWICLL